MFFCILCSLQSSISSWRFIKFSKKFGNQLLLPWWYWLKLWKKVHSQLWLTRDNLLLTSSLDWFLIYNKSIKSSLNSTKSFGYLLFWGILSNSWDLHDLNIQNYISGWNGLKMVSMLMKAHLIAVVFIWNGHLMSWTFCLLMCNLKSL